MNRTMFLSKSATKFVRQAGKARFIHQQQHGSRHASKPSFNNQQNVQQQQQLNNNNLQNNNLSPSMAPIAHIQRNFSASRKLSFENKENAENSNTNNNTANNSSSNSANSDIPTVVPQLQPSHRSTRPYVRKVITSKAVRG